MSPKSKQRKIFKPTTRFP